MKTILSLRYPRLAVMCAAIFFRIVFNLLRGKLRLEFVRALIEKKRLRQGSIEISFLVTSVCGLQCEHCIMQHLLRSAPGYQMPLEEVKSFIFSSEKSGYTFDIMLTGGEPSSWTHLKEGVLLLRRSRVCASLMLFTNATDCKPLLDKDVIAALDKLWISNYAATPLEHVAVLKKEYGHKACVYDTSAFWEMPREKVSGTLPADCLNPEIFLFQSRVYACPHSASIALGNASQAVLSNPLKPGFLKGLARIKRGQQEEICTWCISNAKVREKVKRVRNLSARERGVNG